MFARLSQYDVDPDRVEDAIESFRNAAGELREIDGNQGGFLLVDRDSGRLATLTLWESRAALSSSEVRAASLRRRAVQPAEGAVQAVDCFEIALDFSE